MTKKLWLVAYGRVSTANQLDGYGPDVQTKDMKDWAKKNSVQLVTVFFDGGVSGAVNADERPELSKALQMVADGTADGILAPNMDRLARELTVQEAALQVVWAHGGRVFTTDQGEILPDDDSDPMRTAMRQMAGVFAQLERGLIIKRLKGGRLAKMAAGGYAGGAPAYGQQAVDKALKADPVEAAVLARIQQMRDDGMSYRDIADALNADEVPTKRGKQWQPNTVVRMLNPEVRRADAERAADRYSRIKADKRLQKAGRMIGKAS
ncbi:hypothetical protein Cme02nite_38310 [Catellatospora methionotrophica]|uniref:Uncharacterized protein n=1 Tax=Catellatospora methionotrophica TaxID=121620 RepID=A0A8J3PGA1_9ACTN|nr:recombinase family protein [Catellatospora methionotrophica]GIG15499.1 hypothetical protein Cme02nite_38310 [Catellatospora methionotrophica]